MKFKKTLVSCMILGAGLALVSCEKKEVVSMNNAEEHYTFELNENVTRTDVSFHNKFGIDLAGDLYLPKNAEGKLAAIAISGPFGAVKEQASGFYANQLAARGFAVLAFDPSFTGESGGNVRYMNSPDINTEDFSAAVDFLSVQENIDPEKIGILGICGWGGFAINAASQDTRIKATVASTMYDLHRNMANGYFDLADSEEARYAAKVAMSNQRTVDYKNGTYALAGGVVDPLPDDAADFVKDYYAYYKTPRGYHERSLNSNSGWATIAGLSLITTPINVYSSEIRSAVLVLHGEKAHSRYFGEDSFKQLKGDNKELVIVPGATHTDLYDNLEKIPFDKIQSFYEQYLN